MSLKSKCPDSRVMKMEFNNHIGSYIIPHVALFDEQDLTREEVIRLIEMDEYDPRLIVIDKKQFETVFRSIITDEGETPE